MLLWESLILLTDPVACCEGNRPKGSRPESMEGCKTGQRQKNQQAALRDWCHHGLTKQQSTTAAHHLVFFCCWNVITIFNYQYFLCSNTVACVCSSSFLHVQSEITSTSAAHKVFHLSCIGLQLIWDINRFLPTSSSKTNKSRHNIKAEMFSEAALFDHSNWKIG